MQLRGTLFCPTYWLPDYREDEPERDEVELVDVRLLPEVELRLEVLVALVLRDELLLELRVEVLLLRDDEDCDFLSSDAALVRDVLVFTVPLLLTFVVVVVVAALRDEVLPPRESDELTPVRDVVDEEREVEVEVDAGVALVRDVEPLFVVVADVLLREDEVVEPDEEADLTSLVL